MPMAQEIKNRGYKLLLSDGNINCSCRWFADHFVRLDTYDIEGHLEMAKILDSHSPAKLLVAVLTDAADVGPTVSALCEHYDLPACSLQSALTTRHKGHMRETIQLAHPVWVKFGNHDTSAWGLAKWVNKAHRESIPVYPCVIKSCDNSASRGVTKVNDYVEWEAAYQKAFANNKHCGSVIVEEFLYGEEYATDWYVKDGVPYFANGAQRVFDGFGIEAGHTNPCSVPDIVEGMILNCIVGLGVTEGPFKADLIHTEKYGWVILECATRWSGGFDHTHSAKVATGRDLVGFLLDYSLGNDPDISLFNYRKQSAAAVYARKFEPGVIHGYNHIPEARCSEGVRDIMIMSMREISPLSSCADRPLFVLAEGKDSAEAWKFAVEAADKIQPDYVKGMS